MREVLNAMRREAAQMMAGRASTRLGTIQSYDPNSYAVRVTIEPEGALTGWIPLLSPWVGNGWGMFCAPSVGDSVEVQFQEADHDAPLCCLRLFNDSNRPLVVPAGEFWLQHKSGAFFKLTNDGKASFSDGHGATVTLNGDGTISSTGAWTHTGTINATGTITAPNVVGTTNVTFGGKSGIGHVHTDPQGGNTGAPV